MFFTIIKNYLKSKIEFKNTLRVKHQFEIDGYYIYLDLFCTYSYRSWRRIDGLDANFKCFNKQSVIPYYKNVLTSHFEENPQKSLLGQIPLAEMIKYLLEVKKSKDLDIIKSYFECIMSKIGSGVNTYINKLEVKTISDIRNDKLNKLLPDNR